MAHAKTKHLDKTLSNKNTVQPNPQFMAELSAYVCRKITFFHDNIIPPTNRGFCVFTSLFSSRFHAVKFCHQKKIACSKSKAFVTHAGWKIEKQGCTMLTALANAFCVYVCTRSCRKNFYRMPIFVATSLAVALSGSRRSIDLTQGFASFARCCSR